MYINKVEPFGSTLLLLFDISHFTNIQVKQTLISVCGSFFVPLPPILKGNNQMILRYYNLEIHQINSIHDFHKWGCSCQH